ncbi:MAG TPA: hypothetical protein VE641_09205 [Chthoniobacterales bacterium]|nr:hypothetical protein [Chthoniobacterales bacterium]
MAIRQGHKERRNEARPTVDPCPARWVGSGRYHLLKCGCNDPKIAGNVLPDSDEPRLPEL